MLIVNSCPNRSLPDRPLPLSQKGAALPTIMLIILGLSMMVSGSTVDTNLQSVVVRNTQFQAVAYHAVQSEIQAQLEDINGNAAGEADQIILDLMAAPVGDAMPKDGLGPYAAKSAYTLDLQFMPLCDPSSCASPPGFSLSKFVKVFRGSLEVEANLGSGGAQSKQIQSFWYLLPQSDYTTW